MLTVNNESGLARDVGELWQGIKQAAEDVIVNVSMEDDDVISITVGQGDDFIGIYVPAERVRQLLASKS